LIERERGKENGERRKEQGARRRVIGERRNEKRGSGKEQTVRRKE